MREFGESDELGQQSKFNKLDEICLKSTVKEILEGFGKRPNFVQSSLMQVLSKVTPPFLGQKADHDANSPEMVQRFHIWQKRSNIFQGQILLSLDMGSE